MAKRQRCQGNATGGSRVVASSGDMVSRCGVQSLRRLQRCSALPVEHGVGGGCKKQKGQAGECARVSWAVVLSKVLSSANYAFDGSLLFVYYSFNLIAASLP